MKFKASKIFVQIAKAVNEKYRFISLCGGSSSGKTYSIMQYVLIKALKEKIHISVVSQTLPHLKKGALLDFENVISSLKISYKKNISENYYKFGNGSKIEFFSVDKIGKARGPRRDILIVNEIDKVPEPIFTQLKIRTRKFTIVDYNPVGDFYIDEIEQQKDCKVIHSTYKDNPFLEQSIITDIENLKPRVENGIKKGNEYLWDVYGLGKKGIAKGAVYKNWRFCKSIPKNAKKLPYGLDFGFSEDPTAFIDVYYYNNAIYANELIYKKKLLITINKDRPEWHSIQSEFKRLGINKSDFIVADSAQPQSIQDLRLSGYNVIGTKKYAGSVQDGIKQVLKYPLFITENSVNLAFELRNYKYVEKNGVLINDVYRVNDHLLDALRYVIMAKNILW